MHLIQKRKFSYENIIYPMHVHSNCDFDIVDADRNLAAVQSDSESDRIAAGIRQQSTHQTPRDITLAAEIRLDSG